MSRIRLSPVLIPRFSWLICTKGHRIAQIKRPLHAGDSLSAPGVLEFAPTMEIRLTSNECPNCGQPYARLFPLLLHCEGLGWVKGVKE